MWVYRSDEREHGYTMKTVAVYAALAALVVPALAADRTQRTDAFRSALRDALAQVVNVMAQAAPEPTIRDLGNAALAKLALGEDPREAEKFAMAAFGYQDMDPKSASFGNIPWQAGHPEIRDANSIEFSMQPVGPMLLGYGKVLSLEFRAAAAPHIRAAFAAMRRHNVPVTYTNIFLMKTVNLILAGEAVGDPEAAAEGYAMLDRWIAHTREAGIGEFDTPNYYAVDLNSLLMGHLYAARADGREKFRRVLDLFWSDIAANFFAARGTLSGPHSRCYDFLGGHESVEWYLYQEGLRAVRPEEKLAIGRVYLLQNELARGYHPDPRILKLSAIPERTVLSRWRAEPDRDRYNYVTPEFAIGSTSGHYSTHDKLINIELASSGRELTTVYIAPDITDQPYGKLRFQDRSGHGKPVHAPLNAVSVQEKGAVLVLLDLDPSALAETGSFATNVVLPAAAERIVLDGKPVSVGRGAFENAAGFGSVVGVRSGNAGLAIRVFAADGAGGDNARLMLKADPEGLANGALRLTAYHYRGAPRKLADTHVRVGILFLARRCTDAQTFASLIETVRTTRIEQSEDTAEWRVAADVGGVRLEAARDRQTRNAVRRRVNGQDVRGFVLTVNGRDLAREVFDAR